MIISVGEITWKEWGKFHQGFQVPFSHLYKVKMNSNKLIFLLSLKLYHNLKQFNYWCIFLTQFHLVSNINNLYILCLIVCKFIYLSVRLYPINVKTAEPMAPKFFVGHLGTQGKVYEWTKFQILVSIKIRSPLNFFKFWKSTKFFWKSANYFCFVLRCTQREHVHN